jgi:dihydrofolate reductase
MNHENTHTALIVATSLDGAIGKNNELLWQLSDDLKLFKKITTDHIIVMGRNTYHSIGRPLPNRVNVVISKTITALEGYLVFSEIPTAIAKLKNEYPDKNIFFIGGASIYQEALDVVDELHISRVDAYYPDADVFFPTVNWDEWYLREAEAFSKSEKNQHNFVWLKYLRYSNA